MNIIICNTDIRKQVIKISQIDLSKQYNAIDSAIMSSLNELGSKIMNEIYQYIQTEIYDSYTPTVYMRVYQLMNSLEIVPVQKSGNTYTLTIKVKDEMHEESNWIDTNTDLKGVFDRFVNGFGHQGVFRQASPINNFNKEYIESKRAITDLLFFIRSKGIEIK